jgi:hypothetical protein
LNGRYSKGQRLQGEQMNMNTSHQDLIFSVTWDWVLVIPIVVVAIVFAIYWAKRKQ